MACEQISLQWNNHLATFHHVISGLRKKGSYTDATLACNGKFYPVHKLILSTSRNVYDQYYDPLKCNI